MHHPEVFDGLGAGSLDARFNVVPVRVQEKRGYVAQSIDASQDRSGARGHARLTEPGETTEIEVRLSGVGRVTGMVTLGDGVTVVSGVPVTLRSFSTFLGQDVQIQVSDASGRFAFGNVAVGRYDVSPPILDSVVWVPAKS